METNPKSLIICHQAIRILLDNETKPYSQKQIVLALSKIGYKIGDSTLTKIKQYNPSKEEGKKVKPITMVRVSKGLKILLRAEFSMDYNDDKMQFEYVEGTSTKTSIIPTIFLDDTNKNDVKYHSGGRMIPDFKINFMEQTPKGETIIEMGLRLYTFSNYFNSTAEENYKDRIRKLLNKGINLHCFMLKHNGEFARSYFKIRKEETPSEWEDYQEMPLVVKKLRRVRDELNNEGYLGKMKLLEYDLFPEFHAMVAGEQMLISHYILGVKRSNCPVVEIHKKQNPRLFRKYLTAIKAVKKHSVEIK